MSEESNPPPGKTSNPFGATMRIDLPPEALGRHKGRGGTITGRPSNRALVPRAVLPHAAADFHQLFQNLYDAAFVTDSDGEILMTNPRSDLAFQATPNQLCHTNILALIGGADDSLLEGIRDSLKNNRFVLIQAHCLRGDGSIFPTEISVNRLQLGGEDRMSFFIRDVTLRKEQEEKLRAGNTAIQNASSGIAIADLGGRIQFCNPAFALFFGLPDTGSAAGLDLRELIRAPGRIDEILAQTAGGETWEGDFELERAGGEVFHAQASIIANLDEDGKPAGIVVSVLDITTLKEAQQKMEEFADVLRLRNAQMQEDLDVAGELQVALLPAKFRTVPAGSPPDQALLHFRHVYCPNGNIGGDFFYLQELSPTEASVLIVDVMGHGVRSALVLATIRGLLQELQPLARDPGALLTQLNANFTAIFRRMEVDMTFATAFYAVMDARTGKLRYANAGHPAPYLLQHAEGKIHPLVHPELRSAALGILEGTQFSTSEILLAPKDTLLLYTDGLAEAQAPSDEFFMDHRMEEIIQANVHQPPATLLDALLTEAQKFSGRKTLEDDVCLVAMQLMHLQQDIGPESTFGSA